MDQMNQALLRGYLVILVAQLIFSLLRLWIPARICESLLWVLMVFILISMAILAKYDPEGSNVV